MKDFNYKQLALNELKWMTRYLAVAFVIMLFLPFPVRSCCSVACILGAKPVKKKPTNKKIRHGKSEKQGYQF